jgi:hypothetical protein
VLCGTNDQSALQAHSHEETQPTLLDSTHRPRRPTSKPAQRRSPRPLDGTVAFSRQSDTAAHFALPQNTARNRGVQFGVAPDPPPRSRSRKKPEAAQPNSCRPSSVADDANRRRPGQQVVLCPEDVPAESRGPARSRHMITARDRSAAKTQKRAALCCEFAQADSAARPCVRLHRRAPARAGGFDPRHLH